MKNRYIKHARISERQFLHLLKLFAADLTSAQMSQVTGLNVNTVDRYLLLLREKIAAACERETPFSGQVEVDESYFGARRVKGKRGRGACGKTIVLVF